MSKKTISDMPVLTVTDVNPVTGKPDEPSIDLLHKQLVCS